MNRCFKNISILLYLTSSYLSQISAKENKQTTSQQLLQIRTNLERQQKESQEQWKNIKKNLTLFSYSQTLNDDASITMENPSTRMNLRIRQAFGIYKEKQKTVLFASESDLDSLCRNSIKILNSFHPILSIHSQDSLLKETSFIPDSYYIDKFALLDSNNKKTAIISNGKRIHKFTCTLSQINTPVSSNYEKILYNEDKSVTLVKPRFKFDHKNRYFSLTNNNETICQHFGLTNYKESSIVQEKTIFSGRKVVLNDNRKITHTLKEHPYIKEISCLGK
jgi:hypothetical protein